MTEWILFDCMETLVDLFHLPTASDYARWAYQGSGAETVWPEFEAFHRDYRKACRQIEARLPVHREYEMKERYEEALLSAGVAENREALVRAMDETFWKRYSGECYVRASVAETVKTLSEQYRLGVVSNFKVRSGVRALLREAGLIGYFKFTINSCELGWKKPHDRIYREAADLAGVEFQHMVFVGDDVVNDYEKPLALGFKSILYDPEDRNRKVPRRVVDFSELALPGIL